MAKAPKVVIPQVPVHIVEVGGKTFTFAVQNGKLPSPADIKAAGEWVRSLEENLTKQKKADEKRMRLAAEIDRIISERPRQIRQGISFAHQRRAS